MWQKGQQVFDCPNGKSYCRPTLAEDDLCGDLKKVLCVAAVSAWDELLAGSAVVGAEVAGAVSGTYLWY